MDRRNNRRSQLQQKLKDRKLNQVQPNYNKSIGNEYEEFTEINVGINEFKMFSENERIDRCIDKMQIFELNYINNSNNLLLRDIIKVNNNIMLLINCNEEKWKNQKDKLIKLLELHLFFINVNNLDEPTLKTLNHIENIKMWRTSNLNIKENMEDERYRYNIVEIMCSLKCKIMSIVL